MTAAFIFDKYQGGRKRILFRTFLLAIIDITCINFYFIISALSMNFDWTEELLTTTLEGFLIQIVWLIGILGGIALVVHIIILFGLYMRSDDKDLTN
jgi:ascorbate-specific PTS system EIIC-type component UlaA